MEHATRQVAKGELSHRIEPGGGRLLGRDEIDELGYAFNHMIEQVQQSHQTLIEANQLKMNFLRIAGHELRTPISYMVAMAKLLKDSDDPEALRRAMRSISAKAARLNEIIDSMFKLMSQQQVDREIRYGPVDLSGLLEQVYVNCMPFVEKRSQRLMIEAAEDMPEIQADHAKLVDIVENLVMNAIKFTPDGGIIKVRTGSELGGHVFVSVQDQGPGIPTSDLPHIFEPFYSGSNVMLHSSGNVGYQKCGMGLGLAIVKHFAQLHGGSVRVTSTPNGCTFVLSIPIGPPVGTAEKEQAPQQG